MEYNLYRSSHKKKITTATDLEIRQVVSVSLEGGGDREGGRNVSV
ncbi:unnamed protein product [Callosobruchus maculatus]|uniref:Uncharacterized protein n=1 Tax=Callosobruchus maculatus TaxID=64391 RepID=A0A653BTY0_CALMS|nr:unnamed protein product [Callosobruchus maculatus]